MDERACLLLAPTQAGDISITKPAKPAKPHPTAVPDHGMQQQHLTAMDRTEFRLGMAVHRRMWPWDGMKSPLTDVLELDKGRVEGGRKGDQGRAERQVGRVEAVEAVEEWKRYKVGKRQSQCSRYARRRVGFVDSGLEDADGGRWGAKREAGRAEEAHARWVLHLASASELYLGAT